MPITQTATTPVNVKAVIKTLEGLKPKIKVFWQSGEQQQQIMRSGQVPLGIMWSDRAYQLISQGVKLKVVWMDGAYEPSYWAVRERAPIIPRTRRSCSTSSRATRSQRRLGLKSCMTRFPIRWRSITYRASIGSQLADNPVNLKQLATPNFLWYAQHSNELNTAYENFLRG